MKQHDNDSRVVMTLDAGGTGFRFAAMHVSKNLPWLFVSLISCLASGFGASLALRLAAVAVAVAVLTPTVDAAEFFVAPTGSDANPGTQAQPFASFSRAQSAARAARKTSPGEAVYVTFGAGVYSLDRTLQFSPLDSGKSAEHPVSYRAQPGAEVVISGGRLIGGWQPDSQRPGIWKTKVGNFANAGSESQSFDQLWVNGQMVIRARTPNWWEFATMDRPVVEQTNNIGTVFTHRITIKPEMISVLRGLSEKEFQDIQIVVFHKWDTTREWLLSVSPTNDTITTRGSKMKSWNKMEQGSLYYFENWLGALNSPGEWFLDPQGWLYYWPRPGEDMTQAAVMAPVVEQFLTVQGDVEHQVQHLRFEGIKFRYSGLKIPSAGFAPIQGAMNVNFAAVQLDGARDIGFTNCAIEHIGSTGIWFQHDCQDCRVEHSRLFDLGVAGIRIGEKTIVSEKVRTARITIDNCIVQSGGRIRPDAVAVWIGQSGDNQISHCDIGDFFYTSISAGWTWGYTNNVAKRNRIEYNHLHHLGYRILSDMAGVYTLGASEGTVIRNNVIHDIYAGSYGGWGLYCDEGSSGILLENNLVYNVLDGGFHQHYGKENILRNNILAFSEEGQLAITRAEPHTSFTFEHNLVYWDEGDALGYPGWNNGAKVILRDNLYWRAAGQPFDFNGKTWAQWRALGNDKGSIIADPLFVNAGQRDFHLRADSPARQIGFQPFDPAAAGVYGGPAWKQLAVDRDFPRPFVAPPPLPVEFYDDFERGEASPLLNLATIKHGNNKGLICITNDPSATDNHCLWVFDSPDINASTKPILNWDPGFKSGRAQLAFKIRIGPDTDVSCEWRNHRISYAVGPSLEFKRGVVLANRHQLFNVPSNTWINVEMRASVGRQDSRWEVSLKFPDGTSKEFKNLTCDPRWTEARWVGFSSMATNGASFYLDDVVMKKL